MQPRMRRSRRKIHVARRKDTRNGKKREKVASTLPLVPGLLVPYHDERQSEKTIFVVLFR